MAVRGLGYPATFESNGDSVKVEIHNAYSQTLYAARIVAALEFSTGRYSEIAWTTRERSHGVYTVTSESPD